jgi:signal transduction histidine kinase
LEATGEGFSGALVTTASNVGEALGRGPSAGPELLVLDHPRPDDVTRILQAVDSGGLPRWAVVLLDTNPVANWVEVLPSEELTVPMIRRVFRSAIEQHALRREIARARGDLHAIGSRVAHDLRTEVASILTNSELLREVISKDKPPLSDIMEPIFGSVDALGKIIERLSFMAMVSARGAAKKQLDMGHVVGRALQRMESEILRRKASMIQPDFWPTVSGEAAWIEKIWCDLLTNALIHSSGPARIELGWLSKESGHRFWVRDNGAGVSPEVRSQLFQPFHMMHRANGPRGLGLSMVQRLVELQGGSCGYEHREEGGSNFFFTLPI